MKPRLLQFRRPRGVPVFALSGDVHIGWLEIDERMLEHTPCCVHVAVDPAHVVEPFVPAPAQFSRRMLTFHLEERFTPAHSVVLGAESRDGITWAVTVRMPEERRLAIRATDFECDLLPYVPIFRAVR